VRAIAHFSADRSPGESGFTLIELLVSLALLGMAAVLLTQGLASAGIIAQRERVSKSNLEQIVTSQRVLRATIERLRPITRIDSAVPIVELRGTAGVLTFVGPPFDRDGPDALQRFRLTRTASGDLVLYSAHSRKVDIDRSGTDLVGSRVFAICRSPIWARRALARRGCGRIAGGIVPPRPSSFVSASFLRKTTGAYGPTCSYARGRQVTALVESMR